jgi:hypothetical protein
VLGFELRGVVFRIEHAVDVQVAAFDEVAADVVGSVLEVLAQIANVFGEHSRSQRDAEAPVIAGLHFEGVLAVKRSHVAGNQVGDRKFQIVHENLGKDGKPIRVCDSRLSLLRKSACATKIST